MGDSNVVPETMAATVEYLKPMSAYEITVHDKQIGICLAKDHHDLRVSGFSLVTPADGMAPTPGYVDLTGRVRVGDTIASVDGQDIRSLPKQEALAMISRSRPVTLGFISAPG